MPSPRFLLALLPLAAACADGGAGLATPVPVDSTAPPSALHFLRAGPGTPALGDRVVSFWAVEGQRREVRLMYRPAAGAVDSVEFVRFRVDDRSLVSYADGRPIAVGDSVLITLTVTDTLQYLVDFQPSGLVFSANRPARIWFKYGEADPDLNGDHIVDAVDTALVQSLRVWKQEQATDPFQMLPSSINLVELEVEADVPGFTRFAVSY